jgi:hypothetical protein
MMIVCEAGGSVDKYKRIPVATLEEISVANPDA